MLYSFVKHVTHEKIQTIFQMKENTAMKDEKEYRYDYRGLDGFLVLDHDPGLLGEQLDALMCDLVYVSRDAEDFGRELSDYCYMLRRLRDLFWKMPLQVTEG